MRSMPIVREVIKRVDSGALGEIISIDATEHLPVEHGASGPQLAAQGRVGQQLPVTRSATTSISSGGSRARGPPRWRASAGGACSRQSGRVRPRTYDDGSPAYVATNPGWMGANDAFESDMDVTDHQTAMVEYENGVRLSFHANSHVSLPERRWYIAGTDATMIADLVRNKLMIRPTLNRQKPERIDYGGVTADSHNGADQAMARDLLATLELGTAFPRSRPMTPWRRG